VLEDQNSYNHESMMSTLNLSARLPDWLHHMTAWCQTYGAKPISAHSALVSHSQFPTVPWNADNTANEW